MEKKGRLCRRLLFLIYHMMTNRCHMIYRIIETDYALLKAFWSIMFHHMPFLSALFYIRRETKRIYGVKLIKYLKLLHRFILLLVLQLSLKYITNISFSLQWRHNGRDSVSNHQPHGCLLSRLFRRRSKNISKILVTGLCGKLPVTGEFPAQMASNAENFSIWWRHHDSK